MNLVVGATGMLGTAICRRLLAQGKPVRGLVRPTSDPAKVKILKSMGVSIVAGDLQDRASLDAACHRMKTVITTAATTLSRQPYDSIQATDLEGQISLVEAAREAGARHFVYVSVGSDIPADTAFIRARRTVEAHVKASGMAYTILRPAAFMEVWLGPALGFDIANARVRVVGSGDGKLSWIALGDVAGFAAGSVDNPAAYNVTLELGGPDWLSPNEVIRLCEELAGWPFTVEHVPVEAVQAQVASAKDDYERTLDSLMLTLAKGSHAPIEMGAALRVVPLNLVSVRDYARRMLAAPAMAGGVTR